MACDAALGLVAISDGASTAARPEVWSRLLTESYTAGADPLTPEVLAELRQRWHAAVRDDALPWYAVAKLAEGSAATFLGLRVDGDRYAATGVGDSCLFHLSGERLVSVGPLEDWTQFSRFPALISTSGDLDAAAIWRTEGEAADGDVFVLATDAVAQHLLRSHACDDVVPAVHEHLDSAADFAAYVERERGRGLANDDSTVCVVLT